MSDENKKETHPVDGPDMPFIDADDMRDGAIAFDDERVMAPSKDGAQ